MYFIQVLKWYTASHNYVKELRNNKFTIIIMFYDRSVVPNLAEVRGHEKNQFVTSN